MFPFEQKNSKPRSRTPETVRHIITGRPFEINESVQEIAKVVELMNREDASRNKRVEQIATNHDHLLRNAVNLEQQKAELDNMATVVAMAGGNEHAEAVVSAKRIDVMHEEIRREEEGHAHQAEQVIAEPSQSTLDEVADKNLTDSDKASDDQVNMLQSAKERLKEIYGEAA